MSDAEDRIRTLLLRGDNLLKSVAAHPAVEPRVRELVDRRLEAARALTE